jgi:MFS family permease
VQESIPPHLPAGSAGGAGSARALVSLVVLAAVTALNNVDRGLFALLVPAVQRSIPLGDALIGVLLGPAFMIIYSLAGVPIAWLADRWNRRNIIALGLAIWSLVTAATAAATSPLQLLILRGALGIGEATNIAPTTALVSDLFPVRQRALAFAVIAVGTPVGTLLCFPMVGRISAVQGWRTAFVVMGLIGLVVACGILLLVRETRGPASAPQASLAPGGVRGLAAEFRRAMSSRPFMHLVIAGGFFSFNYAAMAAWVPAFLARSHGLGVPEVGATLGVYRGAFGIVAALAGGALVSLLARIDMRWSAWMPAALCALIVPAELVLLFSPARAVWQAGLALETLFLTAAIPCAFALLAYLADARARSVWTALYLLVFNLIGQSLGPLSVGQLSERLQPLLATQSLRYALTLAPLSMACAAALFARLASSIESAPSLER